ncbi:MAG TPA: maleylpyruvate isomerase family mycothiol-dependent enzyme [Chloroflexota bacterium]|nr:maleylpyruvate isomerase family mycothiol-dependent enzyme [Chloroflexota bacterium]
MALQRDDPVQLIAQEQVRLLAELKKLPEAAWRQMSHCEGWTNARVVAHLASAAEFYHHSVGRGVRGDTLPPSIPGGQRLTVEQWRARSAAKQEELAEKPPRELLASFDQAGTALVDLLRRVAPHNMTKLAWHPRGTWTIAMFVSTRVFELALHGWDVHVSLNPHARIRELLQPFLVHLQLQLGKRSFEPNPELDGLYRFELLGSLAWTTRVFNGKMDHGPLEPAQDATIKTDANHFLLLTACREDVAQLEQRGLLRIEGDRERTEQLIGALCRRV